MLPLSTLLDVRCAWHIVSSNRGRIVFSADQSRNNTVPFMLWVSSHFFFANCLLMANEPREKQNTLGISFLECFVIHRLVSQKHDRRSNTFWCCWQCSKLRPTRSQHGLLNTLYSQQHSDPELKNIFLIRMPCTKPLNFSTTCLAFDLLKKKICSVTLRNVIEQRVDLKSSILELINLKWLLSVAFRSRLLYNSEY